MICKYFELQSIILEIMSEKIQVRNGQIFGKRVISRFT